MVRLRCRHCRISVSRYTSMSVAVVGRLRDQGYTEYGTNRTSTGLLCPNPPQARADCLATSTRIPGVDGSHIPRTVCNHGAGGALIILRRPRYFTKTKRVVKAILMREQNYCPRRCLRFSYGAIGYAKPSERRLRQYVSDEGGRCNPSVVVGSI